METLETSLEQRYNLLMDKAYKFAYESNPARVGWELHPIDCDIKEIKNPEDIKPKEYYLAGVYLPDTLFDKLINVTEGLPMFIDTYLSGRTSINNMLTVYTPENLELQIAIAEDTVKQTETARNNFIERQK